MSYGSRQLSRGNTEYGISCHRGQRMDSVCRSDNPVLLIFYDLSSDL